MKQRFGLVVMIVSFCAPLFSPADAGEEGRYTWYDGKREHPIYLRKDLVAHFGDSRSAQGGFQKSDRAVVMKKAGGVTLYKVDRKAFQTYLAQGFDGGRSPVFSESPAGGNLRALPGGVIVTFAEMRSDESVRTWASENGVQVDKRLRIQSKTVWLVKSAAGLPSLELANRLRTKPGIAAAQPNWWTNVGPQ